MQPWRIYGSAVKPTMPLELAAGALRMILDNGEIRYVRLGGAEVIRRVYVAVRDRNWRTILPVFSGLKIEQSADSFEITFHARHQSGSIDFEWDGRISGEVTGQVRFEMNGRANSTFMTNRTGFCVLHPSGCAGQACLVEHYDGTDEEGKFPADIAPHQPFRNIRAICHMVGQARIRVAMEGEIFEMEDQRNWSDGSFKTYCRPLELPFPYELRAGEEVSQSITIQLEGDPTTAPAARGKDSSITVDLTGDAHGEWVAHVGISVAEGFDQLDDKSLAQLRSLHPRHLRLELDLTSGGWQEKLASYRDNLKSIGAPIEAALICPDRPAGVLKELAATWEAHGLPVSRWLILSRKSVTTREQVNAAREALSPVENRALFGGGTDADFVAVNRTHPPMELLDLLTFSLNPQVHAFDDLSLMENLEAQSAIIASAVKLSRDCPVCVSPVTLKRRFNPDATAPEEAQAGTLPASVDPRQMSLLAAAWTAGSLARLCRADFLTFFETHGWRGVLQGNSPPALPGLFPAEPGDIFPVYHVLQAFLGFFPEHWSAPLVDRPLELAAIRLQRGERNRLLLANLKPLPQRLRLNLPTEATITVLDGATVDMAYRDAEFWVNANSKRLGETSELELSDYAIASIDWSVT